MKRENTGEKWNRRNWKRREKVDMIKKEENISEEEKREEKENRMEGN